MSHSGKLSCVFEDSLILRCYKMDLRQASATKGWDRMAEARHKLAEGWDKIIFVRHKMTNC